MPAVSEFEGIHGECREKVYNFCLRMVLDETVAQDMCQETFMRAYASFASFEGRSSAATWLCSIAHHVCLDHLRRRSLWHKVSPLLARCLRLQEPPSFERVVTDRHAGLAILAELKPRARSLLILRQYVGLGYDELARIFDTTPGSIGVMLNRARAEALKVARRRGAIDGLH